MTTDAKTLLDPELASIIEAFPDQALSEATYRERRQQPFAAVELSDAVVRTDHVVPGEVPVRVRVHRARGLDGPAPCVVSIHGGGYVLGSYDLDDARFDRWCVTHGLVGVSVDYRLAPECAFPGPLEDCYAALSWTFAHADELGIDPGRIGVSGASAGGGLAAGLALLARDRGELRLAFQLLDSPMLDDRASTPSMRRDDLLVWDRESNAFGWRSYLGARYGTDDVPPYAAPARATDLTGLPPTFVAVGAIDGFRDEDVDYAMRLCRAGVPTELHVYPGAPHGFQLVRAAAVSQRALRTEDEWLRAQLC